MSNTMRALTVAAALVAGASAAQADWSRNGAFTGPGGRIVTTQGGGSCSGGACSWGGSTTGPRGGVATRQGSALRTAPGQWTTNGSATGPRGRTATRSGSVSFGR